jgi:hypothetical protein
MLRGNGGEFVRRPFRTYIPGAMLPDHPLTLRATFIGGDRLADDYQVIWNGLPIGRILKQPGIPFGRPNWSWCVIFPGRPQLPAHRGLESDLEECKRRFKVVWSGVRAGLSDADLEEARRVVEASQELRRRWRER